MAWIIGRFWHVLAAVLVGAVAYLVFSRTLPDLSDARTLALTVIVVLFVAIGLAVIGAPASRRSR